MWIHSSHACDCLKMLKATNTAKWRASSLQKSLDKAYLWDHWFIWYQEVLEELINFELLNRIETKSN